MPSFAIAKVYSNTTQVINHNSETSFSFNNVEHDPDGYWSAGAPTRLTVPAGKGGVPFLLFGGSWSLLDPESDCILRFRLNGAYGTTDGIRGGWQTFPHVEAPGNPGQPIGYITAGPVPVVLADGDYVEFRCYIDIDYPTVTTGTFGHATAINAQTWFGLMRCAT